MMLRYNKPVQPVGYPITLSPFEFQIDFGAITLLEGGNGSGKSTFLKLLCGVLQPELSIRDFQEPGEKELRIRGYFQPIPFDPQLSLNRNLHVWSMPVSATIDLQLFEAYKQRLGLLPHMKTRWGACSSGTRQKFGLAVALSQAAELYLLDEPLAHLDETAVATVMEIIQEKCGTQAAFLIATHLRQHWPFDNMKRYRVKEGTVQKHSAEAPTNEIN